MGFCSIGYLPRTMNLSRIDEGEGIEATVQQRKARFHDSCRLQFNKIKLQRLLLDGLCPRFILARHSPQPPPAFLASRQPPLTPRGRGHTPSPSHQPAPTSPAPFSANQVQALVRAHSNVQSGVGQCTHRPFFHPRVMGTTPTWSQRG